MAERAPTEAQVQSAEWRVRMMEQLLACKDHETFMEMLFAGFRQAASEATREAADFVDGLAVKAREVGRPSYGYALGVAAKSIREYDRLNNRDGV